MPKITNDTQIKNYKIPDSVKANAKGVKKITLKDAMPNLFLEVAQGKTKTTKTFYYIYIDKATKKRNYINIGKYPSISLNEARLKATEYTAIRDNGKSIQSAKDDAVTFSEVANKYLDKSINSQTTQKKDIGRLKNHILPFIGNKAMKDLTRRELVALIEKIQDNAVKSGVGLDTSYKCFLLLRNIMRFAVGSGYIENSLLGDIKFDKTFKPLPKEKTHFKAILTKERLKDFVKTLKDDLKTHYYTQKGLLFGLHTALRGGNLRLLKWEYIDLKDNIITIPAKEMKLKQEFKLPLTTQTRAILDEILERNNERGINSPFVFVSKTKTANAINENALNQAIIRLGFGDDMVYHGVRHTFTTICNEHISEHGFNSDIIELCLDHRERTTIKATYDHSQRLKERFELMQWYSDFLENLENE
ncbi:MULTISPECIES: tyrosine-type recombinase/integrase [unclassified Campylobacter]|uniref:tyrosine-type recombinase/integrase n=1 Tax=unclassified Campylobacter TaxID=2593542 RepID=UPI0022E9C923|nr:MULTISPECIES: site-specific integrase [unclassified Campylobacter]MDA3062703.1 site-specific integrase [Campylobacter sp. JMF_14 EL1]MDA3073996.1 site-specific integrase [Campylobacter sp. JMF_10 EL2]